MNFITKYKKGIFILITIICIVSSVVTALYKTNTGYTENAIAFVVTPAQQFFTNISNWVKSKIDLVTSYSALYDENKALKEEIEHLQSETIRLSYYEHENIELTKLLEMDQKYPAHHKVGADIIARLPRNWYDVFYINIGAEKGMEKNMIVLSAAGIAGRIIEVGTKFSQVMPIIDARSSISAQSFRTGDTGIVRGDSELARQGLCRMDYIDADAQIVVGDTIITSNISENYPPGIIIGTVLTIETSSNGLRSAIIEPKTDFYSLEKVLVIDTVFAGLNE